MLISLVFSNSKQTRQQKKQNTQQDRTALKIKRAAGQSKAETRGRRKVGMKPVSGDDNINPAFRLSSAGHIPVRNDVLIP